MQPANPLTCSRSSNSLADKEAGIVGSEWWFVACGLKDGRSVGNAPAQERQLFWIRTDAQPLRGLVGAGAVPLRSPERARAAALRSICPTVGCSYAAACRSAVTARPRRIAPAAC